MKSSKYYTTTSVRCPFYKRESKQEICCSGIAEGSVIHIAFANKLNKDDYKKTYCIHCHQKCMLFQTIESEVDK